MLTELKDFIPGGPKDFAPNFHATLSLARTRVMEHIDALHAANEAFKTQNEALKRRVEELENEQERQACKRLRFGSQQCADPPQPLVHV